MAFDKVINWFEIPTKKISRAQEFYERIFNMKMEVLDLQNIKMRLFPMESTKNGVGGSLVE